MDKVYVGIVPSGTANAMANELDGYRATSHVRYGLFCMHGRCRIVSAAHISDLLQIEIIGDLKYFAFAFVRLPNLFICPFRKILCIYSLKQPFCSLTGNAALAVAEGRWRYVDILKVTMPDRTIYGLVRGKILTA